jgi:phosphohistidine phosphatase SixA
MQRLVNYKLILYFLLLQLLSTTQLKAQQLCYPNAVFLVRHAEKMLTPGDRDPELTEQGHKRAQSLAKLLKDIKLNTIYSSQFKRTQQTVAAIAKAQSLKVEIRNAKEILALSEDVLDGCDENILISGHSNTVPALLKALGLEFRVSIQGKQLRFEPDIYLNDKDDYGTLFKVTFKQDGTRVLELAVF